MKKVIDKETILNLLKYHREAGGFTWSQDMGSNCKKDQIAGSLLNGFWTIGVKGHKIPEQYLVWIVETGEWPPKYLEHIDGDELNNQFSNLKLTDEVYMTITERSGQYLAQITPSGKWRNLGHFATKEEAYQACQLGMAKYYRNYTRTDT